MSIQFMYRHVLGLRAILLIISVVYQKSTYALFGLFFLTFLMIRSKSEAQSVPWIAPTTSNNLKNTLKDDVSSQQAGKKLFNELCYICHGNKGKGDGIGAVNLDPRPADFTKPDFQAQSDGSIYWKITEGNPPMASYKDVLSAEERWSLVNYLRVLGKR
jgi:mono/diheme cytochrome c family protein